MKHLLTGNEAIARGAYEAGVHIATGYPGTPSTEILENLGTYDEVRTEWAPNEKVALEEAGGASIMGARTLVTMKHVGMNVAADPLFTLAYEGVNGGLVVVVCDEPGMHSSQNEQDNRIYAAHSKVALLEPSNSQECIDMMKEAYEISEKFDSLVIIRLTTRVCHSKSPVEFKERKDVPLKDYEKDISKYIMLPAMSYPKHKEMETERLPRLKKESENSDMNYIIDNKKKVGVISDSIAYEYSRQVFLDDVNYLKLGFSYPLPDQKIRDFSEGLDTLYIVEENEPYIETYVKSLGIDCKGKEIVPICGELSPQILRRAFFKEEEPEVERVEEEIPNRPPALCAGCPHRGIFYEVKKYSNNIISSSDIGCYTLGATAPMNVGDTCICMGAGISAGVGMSRALDMKEGNDQKVFGFIGDSTFFHSGMTGLVDMMYSNANMVTVILDNHITAMTGHQENPGSGKNLKGEIAKTISIDAIVEAIGFEKGKNFRVVDGYDLKEIEDAVKDAYESTGPYVLVVRRDCALVKEVQRERKDMKCIVDPDKCVSCKKCLSVGCPAVQFPTNGGKKAKMTIDESQCNGCTLCAQVCPFDAISEKGVK